MKEKKELAGGGLDGGLAGLQTLLEGLAEGHAHLLQEMEGGAKTTLRNDAIPQCTNFRN